MAKTKKALLATLATFASLIVCVFFALTTTQSAYALSGSIAQNDDVYYPVSLVQTPGGTITCDATTSKVTRISGADRYSTSNAVNAEIASTNTYNGVIVCTGQNGKFADALSTCGLSGLLNYPIVLVNGSAASLDADSTDTIRSLLTDGKGDVIVVGGTSSVSAGIRSDLSAFDKTDFVTRISGDDRYETSEAIYAYGARSETGWSSDYAVVATGANFPDALSAGSFCTTFAVPLLLTDQNSNDIENYIATAAAKVEKTIIVGGTSSVSTAKQSTLVNNMRISGDDRYETSAKFAEWECEVGMSTETIGVATGASFPDALGSSGLLSIYDAPLLLVSDDTTQNVCNFADAQLTSRVFIFGGKNSVSAACEKSLRETLRTHADVATTATTTVAITTTPDAGYALESISVTATDGTEIPTTQYATSYTFTMPEDTVTITPTWMDAPEPAPYVITIEDNPGGTVYVNGCIYGADGTMTATGGAYVDEGDIITVVPVAEEGWTLKTLRYYGGSYGVAGTAGISEKSGYLERLNLIEPDENGVYTFVMPPTDVIVMPQFVYGTGEDNGNHTWTWLDSGHGYVCKGCGEVFPTATEHTEHLHYWGEKYNSEGVTHSLASTTVSGGCWYCTSCGMFLDEYYSTNPKEGGVYSDGGFTIFY